jgi:hypothetical protein
MELNMPRKTYRLAWFITLMVSATLGCGLFTNVAEQITGVKETVGSVATDVQTGRDILGTARAIVTDVGSSGLLETAQALATSVGDSGFLSTAQAFATEQGPELQATLQAFATEQGPGLLETAQAMGTAAAPLLGEAPADIPIVQGELENLISTSLLVSYGTAIDSTQVADFYNTEMVAKGWTKVNEEALGDAITLLTFEKQGRTASVTVTGNSLTDKTMVVIAIQPK